jgi:hypothetical protein
MAITLGKDATGAPAFGDGIISATFTEECEVIDVSNRDNVGGTSSNPGYRANRAGFKTQTWEIECHDPTGLITALESNTATSGFLVMGVTENIGVDGAITFTVTARRG